MDMRIPSLRIKIILESNLLKSRILVGKLAVFAKLGLQLRGRWVQRMRPISLLTLWMSEGLTDA